MTPIVLRTLFTGFYLGALPMAAPVQAQADNTPDIRTLVTTCIENATTFERFSSAMEPAKAAKLLDHYREINGESAKTLEKAGYSAAPCLTLR